MAKHPRLSQRITKPLIIGTAVSVAATGVMVSSYLVARHRNVQIGLEGPDASELQGIDNLGKDTAQKPAGSLGLEYGKEEAEGNLNNSVGQNPVNSDANIVNQLLGGTLSFNFIVNDAQVNNLYTFDAQTNTYTLISTTDITLPSGAPIKTVENKSGRFVVENGTIKLFIKDGLSAGDSILGNNNSQQGDKYVDIIYVAENGCVYSTISGTSVEGISSVYTAPTQNNSQNNAQPDASQNGNQTVMVNGMEVCFGFEKSL